MSTWTPHLSLCRRSPLSWGCHTPRRPAGQTSASVSAFLVKNIPLFGPRLETNVFHWTLAAPCVWFPSSFDFFMWPKRNSFFFFFFPAYFKDVKSENCCNDLNITPTSSFKNFIALRKCHAAPEWKTPPSSGSRGPGRIAAIGRRRCPSGGLERLAAPAGGWNFTVVCHIWNLRFI